MLPHGGGRRSTRHDATSPPRSERQSMSKHLLTSPLRVAGRHRRVVACIAPLAVIALGAAVMLPGTNSGAAQAAVGLGTATSFSVLAGSGITNTGPTTVGGDVGTYPTKSETGIRVDDLRGRHQPEAATRSRRAPRTTSSPDTTPRRAQPRRARSPPNLADGPSRPASTTPARSPSPGR